MHVKWEIGKHILDFKDGLRSNGVVNDKNETTTIRQMLKLLAKKMNYSVPSLYHAYHFARVYPEWSDFEKAEFELKKKVGYHYNAVIKSGAQLTWHQVLYKVLFPRTKAKKTVSDRYADLDDPSILEDCSLHPDGFGHRCDGELITVKVCEAHLLLDWVKWRRSSGAEKPMVQEKLNTLEAALEDSGTNNAESPDRHLLS